MGDSDAVTEAERKGIGAAMGVWVARQEVKQFSGVVRDGHGGVRGEENGMVEMFMIGARHGW